MIRYAIDNDFDNIYKLSSKNTKLLGFVHPMEIRECIKNNKIIICEDNSIFQGFCIFNPLKKVSNLLTIQVICIEPNFRGIGLGHMMIDYLKNNYNRDIKATCVKDSDSEKFWSKVAEKYEELPGKKRPICRYIIRNMNNNTLF